MFIMDRGRSSADYNSFMHNNISKGELWDYLGSLCSTLPQLHMSDSRPSASYTIAKHHSHLPKLCTCETVQDSQNPTCAIYNTTNNAGDHFAGSPTQAPLSLKSWNSFKGQDWDAILPVQVRPIMSIYINKTSTKKICGLAISQDIKTYLQVIYMNRNQHNY